MSKQHVTSIDLWHNNHKGTDYMWALPSDVGLHNGIPADNYPENIGVRGRGGALYNWERSSVVSKFIQGNERRCLEYRCSENIYAVKTDVHIIKLYLILRV